MNVNFYDKMFSLYVNGVPCARMSVTLPMRGAPENEFKKVEVEVLRRAGLYLTAKQIVNAQADRLEWLRTIDRIEG